MSCKQGHNFAALDTGATWFVDERTGIDIETFKVNSEDVYVTNSNSPVPELRRSKQILYCTKCGKTVNINA